MLLLNKDHRLSPGMDSRPNKPASEFYRRIYSSSDLIRLGVHRDICFCALLLPVNDVTDRGIVPTFTGILPARASSGSSVA